LNVDGNEITPKGFQKDGALFKVLSKNISTLKSLHISGNTIGSKGVAIIAEISSSLEELSLAGNGICSNGALQLLKLSGLNRLDLNDNYLSGECVQQLQEIFGERLMELDLNEEEPDTDIDDDFEDEGKPFLVSFIYVSYK